MPRSRRNAAASRSHSKGVTKDFVKKKERLGRKKRADNATDVSVRSRQIYLPDALDEDLVIDASAKKGLTYSQLVVRAAHYSKNTRQSALNGLTKAILGDDLAASEHARSDRAKVLRIGLNALQDEERAVRDAANALISATLAQATAIRPFVALLSATLVACLSHIRAEVQISAAQTVIGIFSSIQISPAVLFGARLHVVLKALSDLLFTTKSPKNRAVVLDALTAVLRPHGRSTKRLAPLSCNSRPFYYHQLNALNPDDWFGIVQDNSEQSADAKAVYGELTKRVANTVVECLPVHNAKKEKLVAGLLLSAVRALYYTLSSCSPSAEAMKILSRILGSWSKERNRHDDRGNIRLIHNFISSCALDVANWKSAAAFMIPGLDPEIIPIPEGPDQLDSTQDLSFSLEQATYRLLKSCTDISICGNVLSAWTTRWLQGIKEANVYYVASNIALIQFITKEFLEGLSKNGWAYPELQHSGWDVLLRLPYVVSLVVETYSKCLSSNGHSSESSVRPLCRFVRSSLHIIVQAIKVGNEAHMDKVLELQNKVKNHLLSPGTVSCLDHDSLGDLLAVLYYSRAFASIDALRAFAKLSSKREEAPMRFCVGFLTLIEGQFMEFEQAGSDNVLLDLLAVLSLIIEDEVQSDDPHFERAQECRSIANRLIERVDCLVRVH